MPLYTFQCEHCETHFDVRATFKEKDAGLFPVCPTCESSATRQLLTTGLIIRGSNTGGGDVTAPSFCGPNAGAGCCG